MFFDPKDELNKDLRDFLVKMSSEYLYGEDGLMANSVGKWVTYHMLFSHDETSSTNNSPVAGMEVAHIEIIEDFLNSGAGSHNWKQLESISRDAKTEWVSLALKQIINNEVSIGNELTRYVSSIVDQNKLVRYLSEDIDNRTNSRKEWLENYIQLPIMPIIMKYQSVASSLDSHEQKKKQDQKKLMNNAEDANTRVKSALKNYGKLEKRYDIDTVDSILDMLEEVVKEADISDNDVANFVLMNAPRFDEDVRYLLTTRFPVTQDS
jgi:DNA repair exonuclease SbcCD ATPase subunit